MQQNLECILNFLTPSSSVETKPEINTNRDLKIEFFRHFPRIAKVKKSRDPGLAIRYAFTAYLFTVIYRKVFFTLKHHNPTFEKKDDFLELLLIDYRILLIKKRNFEVNFSAKIEVSG